MFNAVDYLTSPRLNKVTLGLTRINRLLDLFENPQDKIKCVHVAGTNGKGSTCAFLESILRQAGYRVGLYTSPFIDTFEERIQIDRENISASNLERLALQVKDYADIVEQELGEYPSEFELVTAICYEYLYEQKVDMAVIEVGLGGRFDATNVITPLSSVITNIGYDHMDYLGGTIEEIAREKTGIIKGGTPVVLAKQEFDIADSIICKRIERVNKVNVHNRMRLLNRVESPDILSRNIGGTEFMYQREVYTITNLAIYEVENACNAIETIQVLRDKGIDVSHEAILEGLKTCNWSGRFEVFKDDYVDIVVDGAHNPQGVESLFTSLITLNEVQDKKLVGVFGVLADKNYSKMIDIAKKHLSKVYIYEVNSNRCLDAKSIKDEFYPLNTEICDSAEHSITSAVEHAKQRGDEIIVAFGSLYSMSKIRHSLE